MMVDITQEGAVLLGRNVACDGFHPDAKIRVQTHVHTDHMRDFSTSKGYQQILMSPASRDLLILEQNADIPFRDNIKAVKNNEPVLIENDEVIFLSSGHMLGAIQTQVTQADGRCVGYSGDFFWPLKQVIQVNTLVVDSTYGSPAKRCNFSQNQVRLELIDLVLSKLCKKPIMICAHRGTLQLALDILCEHIDAPFICDETMYREIKIYQQYGFDVPLIFSIYSKKGKEMIKNARYVYICDTRKHNPAEIAPNMTEILLSRYITNPGEPVLRFSENHYRVALSGHADFEGTLSYVQATGAEEVITDNYRGGHAVELAMALRDRLGIKAKASSNSISNNWGHRFL